mgnify:CR=1 FL=1|tara:strand:- start:6445 stop:8169 length:1725 start_codon:yes stop_codon:yes gene_type:complete
MCGIAGAISFNKQKINRTIIPSLINSIKHRGPDHSGSWLSENKLILMINTRLSILDLSKKGNQPFYSKDKRYIIVFNGEIYNFKDLKKNLKEFIFYSNSDTEVLLNLYIKYKSKCLKMLEGMFSLAIYDRKNNELFCARDQYGIKPFYYYNYQNQFWFSSEIKTFLMVNKNIRQNEKAIFRYLNSEYHEHIKETFYKNIFKIKPGHFLIVKNSKIIEKQFWKFEKKIQNIILPKKYNDKKKYIEFLINQSVEKSMVSDVPISIASSGGLDSSILQILAQKSNPKINLVSWIFKNSKYSEKNFVDKIQKKTNIYSKKYCVTEKDFLNNLKQITYINEEPFSGLPVISYYLCLKNACKTKVILDGSGLDEALSGYDKYFNKKLNPKLNFIQGQDGSKSVIKNILDEKFYKNYNNLEDIIKLPLDNSLDNAKYLDFFFLKLPRALRFRDKISMSLGKEIRPSFLNDDLITTLFKLDRKDQIQNGLGKYILRDIFKNDIGKKIAFAKKRNIQTPQTLWFKSNLNKWVNNFFDDSKIWDYGWLDKKKFYQNYELFKKGKINNSFFIWKIINLDLWMKNF